MDPLHKIEHWADTHHPRWVDFIRMGLGAYLFAKGISFVANLSVLKTLTMGTVDSMFVGMALAHYIVFAHIVGGLLIAMGIATRTAILFQLPILLGAILLVNRPGGMYEGNLLEAVIVFILLCVFLVYGSGKVSLSRYMRTHRIR